MTTLDKIEELVKELRTVSNMINMGERIAWGRETTLMDKAADALTTIYQRGRDDEREQILTELKLASEILGNADLLTVIKTVMTKSEQDALFTPLN